MEERGRSLAETPTWSVATVTTVLVAICFVVERSLHRFGKWLVKTKRKPLLAALEKIKEELMLLGLLSLILVQASRWVSTICVESKIYSSRFYPCTVEDYEKDDPASANRTLIAVDAKYSPYHGRRLSTANHCNVGYEPFVSYDSMEQLHRLLFVLGVTHVLYCCLTMLLALIKIYSWKAWEMEAHSKLLHISPNQTRRKATLRRQSTFVLHQTSHPWTRNKVLIWLIEVKKTSINGIRESYSLLERSGLAACFYLLLYLLCNLPLKNRI